MLRAAARSTPSKITELGSPPSLPRTNSAPLRSAHVCSCSAAAARNVSPAAISTVRPCAFCSAPTLPIVVVLPTPLTPTNSHTFGEPGSPSSKCSSRSAPSRRAVISSCSAVSSASGVVDLLRLHARRASPSSSSSRHPHADVGAQQRLLEVVPRLVGDARRGRGCRGTLRRARCAPCPSGCGTSPLLDSTSAARPRRRSAPRRSAAARRRSARGLRSPLLVRGPGGGRSTRRAQAAVAAAGRPSAPRRPTSSTANPKTRTTAMRTR